MNIPIHKPVMLTLVTTDQCTAACRDCCFNCSPDKHNRLSYEDMCRYIDQSITAYPTIKIVVLTGGECFLLKEDLYKIIAFIHSRNLLSRVVTNGYWATSKDAAFSILKRLKEQGLTEINFSTGDDHLEWVSYERLKNGVLTSLQCGFTTCINVESGGRRKFSKDILVTDPDFASYLSYKNVSSIGSLQVIGGTWMPFTIESMSNIERFRDDEIVRQNCERCDNIFTSVNITPTHRLVACCGLPVNLIPFLDLGSVKKARIKELYENQFDDFMKIWLFVEGPYKILEFVAAKIGKDKVLELQHSCHSCFYCAALFTNTHYMEAAKAYYKEKFASIMMRYIIHHKNKRK